MPEVRDQTSEVSRPDGIDYFEVIESTFVARRGKHLFVSPQDWQLMEEWQGRGIPNYIVVHAINEVFDKHKAQARSATINSLRYCAPAVDEAYRLWLESRVGANESVPGAVATGSSENNPFSKECMLRHLQRCQEGIRRAAESVRPASAGGLSQALTEAEASLSILEAAVLNGETSAKLVEARLTEVDAHLDEAVKDAATKEQLSEFSNEVRSLLAPHKANLTDVIYWQQFNNFLTKRLRESFGIPRLSLFFS